MYINFHEIPSKFHVLTKILILKSIIGNKIYKSYGRGM